MMLWDERRKGTGARARASLLLGATVALLLGACGGDGVDPDQPTVRLDVVSGDQVAATGQIAPEPLVVRVVSVADGGPVADAVVMWAVEQGEGARTIPASSNTDTLGLASTLLDVGALAGDYVVSASTADAGSDASITVRAFSSAPVLTSLNPASASVGQSVTITGTGFSDQAADNAVFFGVNRATVTSATTTQVVAIVPPCMASGDVDVTVRLGQLVSNALTASITGDPGATIQLAVGESQTLTTAGALDCLSLPGAAGEEFLVIVHNDADDALGEMPYRLTGQVDAPATLVAGPSLSVDGQAGPVLPVAAESFHDSFERGLRERERELIRGVPMARPLESPGAPGVRSSVVGGMADFQVFNRDGGFTTVTAEVVLTSAHAILYQDLSAPAGGFTAQDFADFAAEFDDPIFDADVAAFGNVSDVDLNGRVIILFTPVVNLFTPPGSDGFVAGFFFGLDLTTGAGSNEAEIFYSVVPDPNGDFGDARTRDRILEVVPPVLAHELQHMINFNERVFVRNASELETLWLGEGLAHAAESVVAREFAARGNSARALDFKVDNLARARRYLQTPGDVRLVADVGEGSLAERGAGWMFVEYLRGHFGGDQILRDLTSTTASGTANVTLQTGDTWPRLLRGWLVANYADEAPELLPGGPADVRDSYPLLDLRADFQGLGLNYPLMPTPRAFADFVTSGELPSSAGAYLRFDAGGGAPTLRLRLTDQAGVPLGAGAEPAISVLRLR
ncbi:MAG: IPT/TIG domain-containing protein [Gemmatimonadota bacterium]